jgi:hypothetical protein
METRTVILTVPNDEQKEYKRFVEFYKLSEVYFSK